MTESLATILSARLAPLNLFERLVGLARLYQTQVQNGDDVKDVRLPVPVTFSAADCERDNRYLVPDESTASIGFFEDNGTAPYSVAPGITGYRSTLRFIGWLNPAFFDGPLADDALAAAIVKALNYGPIPDAFKDLKVTWVVLPAENALWSRYTIETPLLYTPYRLIGLELVCTYRYNIICGPVLPERLKTAAVC